MNPTQLLLDQVVAEAAKLQNAIRQHRDERGDDRCYADDHRLYMVLPEGDTRPIRETAVTIENCQKYIECRQTGREYISPQRRIEELETELDSGKGYLTRLLGILAPQCTPMNNLPGLVSQIDNYIAGLNDRINRIRETLENK